MGDGESAAAAAAAATDLCNPCEEARNPSAEDPVRGDEPSSSHQCGPAQEKDDSMLVGPPAAAAVPADGGEEKASAAAAAVPAAAAAAQATEMATAAPAPAVQVVERTEKRKRGRPPRGQVRVTPPKKRRDEEDVCFICFDGGKLVLCDRRGCPKAYHPTCIKRDEAFFRSKAQWNCGWHICSICEKAAHFMCYTCTYSLCKVCISEAEFLCVRGTKGFCTTCMKMVLLIENCMQGDKEMVQVDFDDKSNWEYLFKVYWIYLKGKLSLTIEEVTKAKNPWKGVGILSCKGESSGELYDASNEKGFTSDGSSRNMVGRMTKRRRIKNRAKFPRKGGTGKMVNIGINASKPSPEGAEWASKELLDFVAYMKNGDASILSQFDVQALVLDYVKTNNLRDPRRKSQIICDVRLGNLFGKARVGHMEMLKLLEFHFPVKEKSVVDHMKGGIPNVFSSQVDPDGNNDCKLIINNDKGCKKRKKSSRGRQTNLDDFAAIDVHNINLIYLRRGLMENLIGDAEKFSDKVVGAIVRIRISSIEQKQDLYRLVQVVGISKAAVPYTIGLKTADVMLEILNLDKKEAISIDAISNQEFSEDECGRLRQSIKGGLSKRLTVGEIQKKAMALREVKLIDCLESEILRLSHLRDRASEKGRRKELRECVEKLKLLSTPEERSRRLQEIPEVHTDPSMGLTNDSEGSTREPIKSKQELFTRSRISSMGGEQMSPQGGTDISHNTASRLQNKSELSLISYQQKELVFGAHGRVDELSQNLGRDACRTKNLVRPDNQVDLTDSVAVDLNVQDVLISESSSDAALEALASGLSAELSASAECVNDKIWHYEDPNGKKQGPFCMVQLEKWKTTGYFPPDLKVWRTSETKEDSVLLTDALDGIYHKHKAILLNSYLHSREVSVERETNLDKKGEDINSAENDSVQNKGGIPSPLRCQEVGVEQGNNLDRKAEDINSAASGSVQNKVGNWNDPIAYHNADGECPRNEEQCPRSVWNIPAGFANLNEQHDASFSRALDLLGRSNSWPDQPLMHDSLPSPTLLGKPCETMLQHGREGIEGKAQSSGQDHEKQNSHRSTVTQTTREQNNERTSNSPGHSGQSLCGSPSGWDFNSSAIRSSDTSQQHTENKYPDFPNPTPNHCDLDGKDQIAENKPSVASNAPVQDSGLSWSTASSLVANGAQHPEAAGEWNGYSSNPAKPSVEEWDSGLPSAPLLRLSEAAIDLASTPTSNSGQLTHSSTIHDTSNWQAIVSGPHDFTSLAEESVSDLLAEVDAMELNGLPSPTSIMNCGEEFTQASKSDCFNSIEVLSPSLEPGKSDALSSTGDLQIPFKSTMLDEPQGLSRADSLAVQGRSSGQSPTSAERECEAKHSDASVNQWDTGSKAEAPGRSNTGWDVPATDIAWGAGSDTADNGSGRVQAKADAVRGETVSGNSNMSWGTVPGTVQENANRSHDHSVGFPGMLGGHSRHGSGEKFSFLRDRVRDSSFARGRPSWNRQSSFGGGGSSRPLPKGQRVCKFYENGYCRKGSLCDYLHPRD